MSCVGWRSCTDLEGPPEDSERAAICSDKHSHYARGSAGPSGRTVGDRRGLRHLPATRTATVTLGRGAEGVIGIGRVKTPTLAIACRREIEIREFVPAGYFEVVATAKAGGGSFRMRHAPKPRILKREDARAVLDAARDFEGPLGVRVEDKRQRPPRLHDLPSLQKLCSARFGWPASKTLDVAQELYDGAGKKILTYPRAEVRYLPESAIADVPKIVAGLRAGRSYAAIPVPSPPAIRKGRNGAFHDKGLEGASHHAIVPNVNTIGALKEVWPRLSPDEKKLFDAVARSYLAAVMPDWAGLSLLIRLSQAGTELSSEEVGALLGTRNVKGIGAALSRTRGTLSAAGIRLEEAAVRRTVRGRSIWTGETEDPPGDARSRTGALPLDGWRRTQRFGDRERSSWGALVDRYWPKPWIRHLWLEQRFDVKYGHQGLTERIRVGGTSGVCGRFRCPRLGLCEYP